MIQVFFYIIISILLFDYFLERGLEFLNSKKRTAELPSEVQGIYDIDQYVKQQAYEKAKSNFDLVSSTFSLLVILLMFFYGGFAYVDSFIYSFLDPNMPNHIVAALLFFGVLMFASDIIGIPFDIYHTFVIEQKFGFNTSTKKLFILDKIKSWILGAVLGGGILTLLLWLLAEFQEDFWLYAWVLISVIMIFFTMFYSSLIVPLFNKQTPLPNGDLKDAIFSFAQKVGFKLDNIYVIDGSKRSTKANAYFTGLGSKKRIVLYDTLISDLTTDEIVAVLAHEIGHYKKKHTYQMIGASLLQMGIMLFIFGIFINQPLLTQSLGVDFVQGKYHIALFVFSILYSPLSFLIGIFMNIISRKNEFEADNYAGTENNSENLISALKKLVKKNLSNLTPHPAYVFFYYSHPPVDERINALRNKK